MLWVARRPQYYDFVAALILYEFLAMTPGLQAAPVDVPSFIADEKGQGLCLIRRSRPLERRR